VRALLHTHSCSKRGKMPDVPMAACSVNKRDKWPGEAMKKGTGKADVDVVVKMGRGE